MSIFLSPRTWLKQLWLSRLQAHETWQTHQRNVYILPTRAGWMLAVTWLCLLIGSINYQLNLGYLLTFSLSGVVLAGIFYAHRHLRDLQLRVQADDGVHAGQTMLIHLSITQIGHHPTMRWSIGLRWLSEASPWSWCDVHPQQGTQIALPWLTVQRGWQSIPIVEMMTLFPLGLFRVWTVWRPALQVCVYPKPLENNHENLPYLDGFHHANSDDLEDVDDVASWMPSKISPSATLDGDEWDGLCPWQKGQSPKHILWRKATIALALDRETFWMREWVAPPPPTLWLNWDATPETWDRESRISLLTSWIMEYHAAGYSYGLRCPTAERPPQCGIIHQNQCLKALAEM